MRQIQGKLVLLRVTEGSSYRGSTVLVFQISNSFLLHILKYWKQSKTDWKFE